MKGVAALPVLLIGLLKRGEKAAAAATSTSVPVTAAAVRRDWYRSYCCVASYNSSISVTASADRATVPWHKPHRSVPVIAKAAVGLGLAAAVFTPTDDSVFTKPLRISLPEPLE